MNIYAISGLINALMCSILGLLVYFKNKHGNLNKKYALFCLFVAFWSYGYFFWQIAGTKQAALFWCRVLMAGTIFIPVSFLHFTLILLEAYDERRKAIVKFGYAIFSIFLIFDFTPLFVKDVTPKLFFNFWPSAGIVFLPFLSLWLSYCIYACYLLFRNCGVFTGTKKNQIKYVLIGIIIGYVSGSTNYFLWYDIPIPPFGNFIVPLFVGLMAYAIIKYRLMDITLVARDTVVFLLYFAAAAIAIPGAILLRNNPFLLGLLICFILVVSPFLHQIIIRQQVKAIQNIINWIDRKLFRGKFLYLNGLTEFWEKTGVVYTSSQLAWTLVPAIAKMMDLTSCSFLLFERNKKEFVFKAQAGLDEILGNDETLPNKTVSVHSALIRHLSEKKQIAVYDELEKSQDKQTQEAVLAMKQIGSCLSAPIFIANRLTAVLNLGSKKNKDMFSEKDFKIVKELVEKTKNHLSHTVFLENSIFFSGTLAHDIRSMFKSGIIYEYLGEIRDGLEKDTQQITAKEAVDDLGQRMEKIQKMSELMVDIHSSLERFVTGKFKPQRINYSELVSNVTKGFLTQAKGKGIKLEVILPEETFFISAEPLDVERILTELLTNAIKYTRQGKVSIEVYQENPDEVLTKIADTGKGIAEENLDDIFEPFTRIKNGIDTEGKGIGLTSVRQLLDVNAGRIWVKSRLDEGSSFFFVLPCVEKGG